LQALTLVAGLRLCAHLARAHGIALRVKWPNDLVCDGRKIAGILTESRLEAGGVRDLVLGLGINVNGAPGDCPGELRHTSGSLAHARGGVALDINATAADIIATVLGVCARYFAEGKGADFDLLWRGHDYLHGKTVTARFAGGVLTGEAVGLDATGALLVWEASGNACHALNAGEVTLAR
jgi:BirA family biotin operon repressor/biotin-[acetyl-CoA-carboxylase] ligase